MTGTERRVERKAFTLIELVLAATIFAIIAVSVYSTFSAGIRVWLKTAPMIEANQARRAFFNAISLDLRNAIIYKNPPNGGGAVSAGGVVNFEGTADRMAFMCIIDAYVPSAGFCREPAKVIYKYDKANNTIKRFIATKAEGLDEAHARAVEMVGGVEEDFGFEYCYKKPLSETEYEYEWKDAWDGANASRIPRGVRVRLGGLRKTVFIPAGELGKE